MKAHAVEAENHLAKELEEVQQKFERLLSENIRLRKKEVSFKSFAKESVTLNEVQTYLRSPSEKGGLGLDYSAKSLDILKKNDKIIFVKGQLEKVKPICNPGEKAKSYKGKKFSIKPLQEYSLSQNKIDKNSKKFHNPNKCNHPNCYATRDGRIA